MPQVSGGARFAFAPGPSAQGVVAVGDVQAGLFDLDKLAFGVELSVLCGLADDADFGPQGVVFPFVGVGFDQAVVFDFAAFGDAVAAQVVVVLGVVFLDELALLIPLVVGVAGLAVDNGFHPGFGVPAVASCGRGPALPSSFDQAAVAVVDLGLFVVAGLAFGFSALAVEGAADGRLAVDVQAGPVAMFVVLVGDLGAVRQGDGFQAVAAGVAVADAVLVLVVVGDLAVVGPGPAQPAVGAGRVAAAAVVVVLIVAGDRGTVLALAGLGDDAAAVVPFQGLDPDARVFPADDVAGGVVVEADVPAVRGGAAVDLAPGVPAQLPLVAVGPGDAGQALLQVVVVLDAVAIGAAVGDGPGQFAVVVVVGVTDGVGVGGELVIQG